jgi:amino acid permease
MGINAWFNWTIVLPSELSAAAILFRFVSVKVHDQEIITDALIEKVVAWNQ